MAKRQNRLGPLDHERRQLDNLKTLEPIATPDDLRPLSDALIDLALASLDEVYRIEETQTFEARQLERIHYLANALADKVILVQGEQPAEMPESD